MSGADWVVGGILAILVMLVVHHIYKRKKSGASCSGCSNCPYSQQCNAKTKTPNRATIKKPLERYSLAFQVLERSYAVCQFPSQAVLPEWVQTGEFLSLTRTAEELSVVCVQAGIPENISAERDWRILQIAAVLDFSLVGVLAAVSNLLGEVGISIFVISTYNTDYLLVKERDLTKTVTVLKQAGHHVVLTAAP
jgi:hypothetical protein